MIKSLCGMNACRYELDQITGGGFQSRRPPRGHSTGFHLDSGNPSKMMRGGAGYRGRPYSGGGNKGGYSRYDNYSGYRGGSNRGYGMNNSRGRSSGNRGGRGSFRSRY